MKNGIVYRALGNPDKDETILFIWDGLRRIVVRDTKVARITPDSSFRTGEHFRLVQPLTVHAGQMPKEALRVEAEPWNEKGRRAFRYVGSNLGKPVAMEQAIIELGPHLSRIRGVDGFWQGQVATNQIPREIVTSLLGRVDQSDEAERERVVRFFIDAGWYPEAKQEIDRLIADFPKSDLAERAGNARIFVVQAEAGERRAEIEVRRRAQQPKKVRELLSSFTESEIGTELLNEVRELIQQDDRQQAADQALARQIRSLADRLPESARAFWKGPIREVLRGLETAPDAVRVRLKGSALTGQPAASSSDEAAFARLLSAFVVGPDDAVDNLAAAETLWKARGLVHNYLANPDYQERTDLLHQLDELDWPARSGRDRSPKTAKFEWVSRLVPLMPPPLQTPSPAEDASTATLESREKVEDKNREKDQASRTEEPKSQSDGDGSAKKNEAAAAGAGETEPAAKANQPGEDGQTRMHQVSDDSNVEPTEYLVRIPPEYNALRRYPAVVLLHNGQGPRTVADRWAEEAARRGYILIAPEYNIPGESKDYRYTPSEHAAVELSLRDARRRYAIDSDRVFVAGSLSGGDMAWDYGLAHPDLFAGAIVFSGLPARYVPRYLPHHEHLPLLLAIGELAPASTELVFGRYIRPLILKSWDVTYVEYNHRGLEDFPEEIPAAFEWMGPHRRDPFPKTFEIATARESDNRFFGVVIQEFTQGRTTAPEAVEVLGQNLNPATIKFRSTSLSNLVRIQASGVRRLDVWLGPEVVDFHRRLEIRVNDRTYFKGEPELDLETMLEDLRLRGDRQQIYWLKVPIG
jgi:pimeloyl-ACP methyl ester carboxylesterase